MNGSITGSTAGSTAGSTVITNSPACHSCGACCWKVDRCNHCGNCRTCGKPVKAQVFDWQYQPVTYPTYPNPPVWYTTAGYSPNTVPPVATPNFSEPQCEFSFANPAPVGSLSSLGHSLDARPSKVSGVSSASVTPSASFVTAVNAGWDASENDKVVHRSLPLDREFSYRGGIRIAD